MKGPAGVVMIGSIPMSRKSAFTLVLTLAAAIAVGASRPRASRPPSRPAGPTFSNEVSRIFQQNCDTCHHPGDIGPFSTMTYSDAAAEADNIKYMVETRQMPPWKPVEGCSVFANPRVLAQSEIDAIAKWVDNGAPEGKAADLPPALHFDGGWALGQPDLIVSNPTPYTPPATEDMYRCYSLPVPPTASASGANLYVSAIDIKPGDRQTVHHAIAFIDNSGQSATQDTGSGYPCFGGPGVGDIFSLGALGGWAPGARPYFLPDGVAMSLPKASRIVLQVHYHPHLGRVAPDQTQMGIYLSRKLVDKIMSFLPVIQQTFTIPAGASSYAVTGAIPFIGLIPVATHVIGIFPHMHLLGRQMKVETSVAGGEKTCLVNIADWDFNWQGMYVYNTPVALPANSKPVVTAIYDNSSGNPKNPNTPPRDVSWGEQTTDEMCIAFLAVTFDSEHILAGVQADRSWIPPLMGTRKPVTHRN